MAWVYFVHSNNLGRSESRLGFFICKMLPKHFGNTSGYYATRTSRWLIVWSIFKKVVSPVACLAFGHARSAHTAFCTRWMLNSAVCCDVWLGHPAELIGVCCGTQFYIHGMSAPDIVVSALVWKLGQHSSCVSTGDLPLTLRYQAIDGSNAFLQWDLPNRARARRAKMMWDENRVAFCRWQARGHWTQEAVRSSWRDDFSNLDAFCRL